MFKFARTSAFSVMTVLGLAFAGPQTAEAAPFSYTNVAPDLTVSEAAITVFHFSIADSLTIADLGVTIDMWHSFAGDLNITLSNGVNTATLLDRPGVPANTFGNGGDLQLGTACTYQDDAASGLSSEAMPISSNICAVTNNYIPFTSLSIFDGSNLNGQWTLTIQDFAASDTGTLRSVTLFGTSVDASDVPAPGALMLLGSGILGLAGLRRRTKRA